MSVRPYIECIVGIDDKIENDPRRTMIIDIFAQPPIPLFEYRGYKEPVYPGKRKEIYLGDVLFDGNPTGSGLSNVLGFIIETASEDLARFVFCYDEKLGNNRYFILPHREMSEYESQAYVMRGEPEAHLRYKFYTPWYEDIYKRRALHVLHYAGWEGITIDQLKFMIVCYWS